MSGSVGSIIGILLPDLRHFNSSVIPHWGLMTLAGRWLAAGGRDRPPRTACCWSSWSPASYPVVYFGMVWYGVVWYCVVQDGVHSAHCRTLGSRFRCLCRINIPTDVPANALHLHLLSGFYKFVSTFTFHHMILLSMADGRCKPLRRSQHNNLCSLDRLTAL